VSKLGADSRVLFTTSHAFDPESLQALDGVTRVEREGDRVIVYGRAAQSGKQALISEVANWLSAQGAAFSDIRMEQPNLEDVFLQLTGRAMRD